MDTPPKDNAAWASYIDSVKGRLPKGPFPQFPTPSPEVIRRSIDHTLLSESATEEQVHTLCAEAQQYGFASVCVRLRHVSNAAQDLKRANASSNGAKIGITCVVSFPGGMDTTANKEAEARKAVELGASELDMVMKYQLLHEGKYREVYEDVAAVRAAAPHPTVLKVILETSQLSEGEIVAGTVIAGMACADYVKTSTGFKGQGATILNVELMHAVVDATGNMCKVKASGGVQSAEDCVKMLKAGAARIGASSGVRIVKQLDGKALSEQGGIDTY
jgi:deoxyribose-phosphate aldolase